MSILSQHAAKEGLIPHNSELFKRLSNSFQVNRLSSNAAGSHVQQGGANQRLTQGNNVNVVQQPPSSYIPTPSSSRGGGAMMSGGQAPYLTGQSNIPRSATSGKAVRRYNAAAGNSSSRTGFMNQQGMASAGGSAVAYGKQFGVSASVGRGGNVSTAQSFRPAPAPGARLYQAQYVHIIIINILFDK
jgi:hypothetical protein